LVSTLSPPIASAKDGAAANYYLEGEVYLVKFQRAKARVENPSPNNRRIWTAVFSMLQITLRNQRSSCGTKQSSKLKRLKKKMRNLRSLKSKISARADAGVRTCLEKYTRRHRKAPTTA
jgi:hypothetical protein